MFTAGKKKNQKLLQCIRILKSWEIEYTYGVGVEVKSGESVFVVLVWVGVMWEVGVRRVVGRVGVSSVGVMLHGLKKNPECTLSSGQYTYEIYINQMQQI